MAKKKSGGPRIDRRTMLKGIGAAAASPMLPGCEPTPEPDALPDFTDDLVRERIDTVVWLMMENRSFDHYLGDLSLSEGRDVEGLQEGMSNPDLDGQPVEIHRPDSHCIADPPHGWGSGRGQFNDGANDGFVREHAQRHGAAEGPRVMGYYGREDLPAMYAIADAGTVCDRWFCSQLSSTWPNRFYSLAGQNGGEYGNDLPDEGFPHIFDRCDEAGIEWANYYGNVPFSVLLQGTNLSTDHYRPLEDFYRDADGGLLPPLTLIDPIFGRNDDHPPAHHTAGQILIASIYEALARSPHWGRCLFVVTYDEHGGYFDHVPPPTAPDDHAGDGHEQLGFRVPTLVAGPWARQGAVDSATFDHTSWLAFVERLWGLEPLTARDAAANDMWHLLDADRIVRDDPAPPATMPVIEADEDVIYADECVVSVSFRDAEPGALTGQPELEAWLDTHAVPPHIDRRDETDAIYERVLAAAEQLGVLDRG